MHVSMLMCFGQPPRQGGQGLIPARSIFPCSHTISPLFVCWSWASTPAFLMGRASAVLFRVPRRSIFTESKPFNVNNTSFFKGIAKLKGSWIFFGGGAKLAALGNGLLALETINVPLGFRRDFTSGLHQVCLGKTRSCPLSEAVGSFFGRRLRFSTSMPANSFQIFCSRTQAFMMFTPDRVRSRTRHCGTSSYD